MKLNDITINEDYKLKNVKRTLTDFDRYSYDCEVYWKGIFLERDSFGASNTNELRKAVLESHYGKVNKRFLNSLTKSDLIKALMHKGYKRY